MTQQNKNALFEATLDVIIPPLAVLAFALSMAFAIAMIALSYALAGLALYAAAMLAIGSVIAVALFGKERVEAWLAGKGINIRFPS